MKNRSSLFIFTAIVTVLILCLSSIAFSEMPSKDYTKRYLRGDMNIDDAVNTGDATILLKKCAADTPSFDSELQRILADANCDDVMNTADATYILRICVDTAEQLYYDVLIEENVTLTFDAGEGALLNVPAEFNGTNSITVKKGTDVLRYIIGENALSAEKDGYTFIGWSNGAEIINSTFAIYRLNENLTLTAVYEEIKSLPLTIKWYDSFNEMPISQTETLELSPVSQSINLTTLNIPEGYKLDMSVYGDGSYMQWVDVENGKFLPSEIKVSVYPFKNRQNIEHKLIKTLKGFLKIQDDLSGSYMLNNDIDMSSIDNFMPFGWNWSNVDLEETHFTGLFDGDNHTITSLRIRFTIEVDEEAQTYSQYTNVGLFSINSGTIRNVSVYTRDFTGDLNYGVFGDINVGVIAGYNAKKIENCHAFGNVGAYDYVDNQLGAGGGIAGTNGEAGVISQCSFEGGAEGFFHIGGISGKNFGTINESFFIGGINWDVEASFAEEYTIHSIGGIVGGNTGTVKNSYAYLTYDMCGYIAVGGLLGRTIGGQVQDCWVYGAEHILFVEEGYGGLYIGYVSQPAVTSGLINYAEQSGLPSSYDASVWDMNAAFDKSRPDLVNNRRRSTIYDAIAD